MAKILLDYVFPITVIENIPQASTAFLKQVAVVVKVKAGQEALIGVATLCVSKAEVAAITDNDDADQLFDAGMSRVYIIGAEDLDLSDALDAYGSDFFTVLISSDFTKDDIIATQAFLKINKTTYTAKLAGKDGNDISIEYTTGATAGAEVVTVTAKKISVQIESGVSTQLQIKTKVIASAAAMLLIEAPVIDSGEDSTAQNSAAEDNLAGGDGLLKGGFKGVFGYASEDKDFIADFAAVENQVGFYGLDANGGGNLFYAFGVFLSASSWGNQQYISMPKDDEVNELGDALNLFDGKVSFVINDDEFAKRLALFAVGGKAIVAPYIIKDLCINMQSKALTWIAANQPAYTLKEASLLETRIKEDVINAMFINTGLIADGTVEITLVDDNFIASGAINVAEPKALWRVESVLRQTL